MALGQRKDVARTSTYVSAFKTQQNNNIHSIYTTNYNNNNKKV